MNEDVHSKASATPTLVQELAQLVRTINAYLEENPNVHLQERRDGTIEVVENSEAFS